MMTAWLAGFSLGFSLIAAIGAQNAFVLKQGLERRFVLLVCLICACSDAILITIGVLGFAWMVDQMAAIAGAARLGGAVFLVIYGARSFWLAARGGGALTAAAHGGGSWRQTALICLAFTWLNPHVYLDTVVLLGSVSTQYADANMYFAAGAAMSSFAFFFALGYGARLLSPMFRAPVAWRVLDALIGVVMWALAVIVLRM